MITEVYINDQLIDLEDEEVVTATYGSITFGELNKRKGVKSNVWNAPFSPRNKLIFEGAEVSGSHSVIPYRKNSIRVDVHGVTVFEGFCILDSSEENYKILSFSGASDFYYQITNKKVTTLDLSEFNHVWSDGNIHTSWANTKGYIYAYVPYGKELVNFIDMNGPSILFYSMPIDYLLPQIFFHSVIRAIAKDAGYTLIGDVLTNNRFLKHIIIVNNWPLPISFGGVFLLSSLLPDIMQSKIWLDFANIYGLRFDINEESKEIRCEYIDDIIFTEPQDWTSKVDRSKKRETKYSLPGYGQSSILKFKSDPQTDINGCHIDYAMDVSIDDTTLVPQSEIYKSDFYLIQDLRYSRSGELNLLNATKTFTAKTGISFYGCWDPTKTYYAIGIIVPTVWVNGTYYRAIATSTNENPVSSPDFWEPVPEKEIWEIKSRPMYGSLRTDLSSQLKVRFETDEVITKIIDRGDLDWVTTYSLHYRLFQRIISRTKTIEQLIKLNYSDINQLDFSRSKIIDGDLYALEEVTQYKLNRVDSTICKLIRM